MVGALDDEAVVPVLEPVAGAVDAVPAWKGAEELGPEALPEFTLFDGALFDGATAPASGSADGSASIVLSAGTLPVDVLPDGALAATGSASAVSSPDAGGVAE